MILCLICRILALMALAVLVPGIIVHIRLWPRMGTVCRCSFVGLASILTLMVGWLLAFSFMG